MITLLCPSSSFAFVLFISFASYDPCLYFLPVIVCTIMLYPIHLNERHRNMRPPVKLDNTDFQVSTEPIIISEDIIQVSEGNQNNFIKEESCTSSVQISSALPPSTDWPGEFNFDVSFEPQEKSTKGISWTYSTSKKKLYVGKDVPCPINFSANAILNDVFIRATVLYSSPEHTSEVVQRCATHVKEDNDQGLEDVEHFLRCESNVALYESDRLTKQRSVVVPFENPPAGQEFSTYLWKFSCFGSCVGGPNRRSLMIIFKLEHDGREIGRRKVEVKVCACPGRDRKTEERAVGAQPVRSSKRTSDEEFFPPYEPKQQRRAVPNENGYFTIRTKDVECFNFLKEMKKMYNINAAFKKLPLEVKRNIMNQDSRSSEGE